MYIIALTTHGLTIPVCCARFRYSHDGMLFIFGQLTEPTPRWALGTNPTPPPTDHFFLVNPDGTSISAVARYGSAFKRIESVGELKEEGFPEEGWNCAGGTYLWEVKYVRRVVKTAPIDATPHRCRRLMRFVGFKADWGRD